MTEEAFDTNGKITKHTDFIEGTKAGETLYSYNSGTLSRVLRTAPNQRGQFVPVEDNRYDSRGELTQRLSEESPLIYSSDGKLR